MGDVDRENFLQIATYMIHFEHLRGKRLMLGGLLHPLSEDPQTLVCHDRWLGDEITSFVVDGIAVPEGDAGGAPDVHTGDAHFVRRLAALVDART